QAIGATTDKLQDSTRFILSELNQIDPDLERINDVIRNNGGPVRWISIPQTWEQENNARIIEEEGGWCRVFIPSDLESEKGREEFKNAIDLALNQPLTPAELAFWKRLYGNSTKSAPALHTAL